MININGRLRAVLALALMLSAATVVSAQTKTHAKAHAKTAADAEFKALINGYYKAWTITEGKGAQVPNNAARFYAKDADLVFYDLAPLKYNGWAEYKQGVMKTLIDNISSSTFVPNDDLKVTRRGTVA